MKSYVVDVTSFYSTQYIVKASSEKDAKDKLTKFFNAGNIGDREEIRKYVDEGDTNFVDQDEDSDQWIVEEINEPDVDADEVF